MPRHAVSRHHTVDLSEAHLALIRQILSGAGVLDTNMPVLFGSRVTGQARRYSDVDIGFSGEPVAAGVLSRLREAFEESALPYSVDVLNLSEADPSLREHALAHAVALEAAVGRPA